MPLRRLCEVRSALWRRALARHAFSLETEKAYWMRARQFILHFDMRHPEGTGDAEAREFLTHLAADRELRGSSHSRCLNAPVFLCRLVPGKPLGDVSSLVKAARVRMPVVLPKQKVTRLLAVTGFRGRGLARPVNPLLPAFPARRLRRAGGLFPVNGMFLGVAGGRGSVFSGRIPQNVMDRCSAALRRISWPVPGMQSEHSASHPGFPRSARRGRTFMQRGVPLKLFCGLLPTACHSVLVSR